MIVQLQKDATEKLGISTRCLRRWQKEPGFPDYSNGFNIPKIVKWLKDRQKKGFEEGVRLQQINVALKTQKLRIEKSKADRIEDEREIEKGNLIARDEYDLAIIELITIARDYISAIPKLLCKFIPKKYQIKLIEEGDRLVRNTLDNLVSHIDKIIEEGVEA